MVIALPFNLPGSDAKACSEYVSPDGAVYEYETYGSNAETYHSVICGFSRGASDGLMILSALEGYKVTGIAPRSFSGCDDILYVVIPERTESIGGGAFSCCESLTDVYFLGGVPSEFAEDAFDDGVIIHYIEGMPGWDSYSGRSTVCMSSGAVESPDGSSVRYSVIGDRAVITGGNPNEGGEVILPSSIETPASGDLATALGAWAFCGREDIADVVISPGMETISERAFYKCASLRSVIIPDTVTVVMDEAFRECGSLGDMRLSKVRFVGFEAFRMCHALTEIRLSDGAVFIGEGAFRYCTSVERVILGGSISEISPWLFDGCGSLDSIEIPGSVTVIGEYAFHRCESLTSVTVPGGVTKIGDRAFYGCSALSDAYFEERIPEMGSDVFGKVSTDFCIHTAGDRETIVPLISGAVFLAVLVLISLKLRSREKR